MKNDIQVNRFRSYEFSDPLRDLFQEFEFSSSYPGEGNIFQPNAQEMHYNQTFLFDKERQQVSSPGKKDGFSSTQKIECNGKPSEGKFTKKSGTGSIKRKISHNASERKRREKINKKIDELRKLLPGEGQGINKAAVLHQTAERIKNLQSIFNKLAADKRKLESSRNELLEEVYRLRSSLNSLQEKKLFSDGSVHDPINQGDIHSPSLDQQQQQQPSQPQTELPMHSFCPTSGVKYSFDGSTNPIPVATVQEHHSPSQMASHVAQTEEQWPYSLLTAPLDFEQMEMSVNDFWG